MTNSTEELRPVTQEGKYPADDLAFHVAIRNPGEPDETYIAKDRATLSGFPTKSREDAYAMVSALNRIVQFHAERHRLNSTPAGEGGEAEVETYRHMHEIATIDLGYPSILEALEATPHQTDHAPIDEGANETEEEAHEWVRKAYREPDDLSRLDDFRFTRWNMAVAYQAGRNAPPAPAGLGVGEVEGTDYSEQALADRQIDFLETRAEEWMADTGVQRMFNAIASVFEPYAPQEIMDRFREKMGVIGRQCHVEGALRVWEEIAAQQRALGHPLPADPDAILAALSAAQPPEREA